MDREMDQEMEGKVWKKEVLDVDGRRFQRK